MELDSKKVYLLLGSNLGDRKQMIEQAIAKIGQRIGPVFARSSFYETAPWGNTEQPAFLNLALGVDSALPPIQVLDQALAIELELGRVRKARWGERLIDIDLILYGQEIVAVENRLHIPHPEMQNRKFVLEPLSEIAGEVLHPRLNLTISQILTSLTDNLSVSKI